MRKQRVISLLCLCLSLLLTMSLAACKETDEQNSDQPTASIQPTAAPTPTPPPIPYTDVAVDAPYYDAVVWAYKNGIASDGETFGPADACTRGQVITFLWRAKGSPEPWIMENPLDDASPDDWYYKPALWAYQHNIATSTTVNPKSPCTNAEALTFLWRAEGKPDKLNTLGTADTYYAQPMAWADQNGLLSGTGFDPAAPCTRADLMAYLYWAAEQWTPSGEEQRIQTEYDKILYSTNRVSDYVMDYAEYIDADGDGKVELLTLSHKMYASQGGGVLVTVYADIDGHIEKSCEAFFQEVKDKPNLPEDTFLTDGGVFSLYRSDGQLYLCQNRYFHELGGAYMTDNDLYDFYKIGTDAITFCEQRNIWTLYNRETGETHTKETETSRNYTKQKDILRLELKYPGHILPFEYSILDRGISPGFEGWEECQRYWNAYWETSDPVYAAALSGDFSVLAPILTGNYKGGRYGPSGEYGEEASIVIDKEGAITGAHTDNLKTLRSVTVRENGEIYFETEYHEEVEMSLGYTIYLPGCAVNLPVRDEPSNVRISRWLGSAGDFDFFVKTS